VGSPLAIAMWDFSWLERRWPGAGYEDWDRVLGELRERGYDAVRIDPYPHLLAAAPDREWTLLPCWNQQDWGAPARIRLTVREPLLEFLRSCRRHGVQVALSTWFRQDADDVRLQIRTPQDHAAVWRATLGLLERAGLLDRNILYVDLCNEFPLPDWAPFLPRGADGGPLRRASAEGTAWMREAIAALRAEYRGLPYCFSITSEYDTLETQDVSFMDVLEPHLWMTHFTDFYQRVGYRFERFAPTGYENLVAHGEELYRSDPAHWQGRLREGVRRIAAWGQRAGKPLITTEGWGVVDYKDWPLLDWGWVKELCAVGVETAAATGQWVCLATSNFCGPQFVGMWRDVAWHRAQTERIHRAQAPAMSSVGLLSPGRAEDGAAPH
jgi:hypothetical protein